jgi:hypothetical protein
MYPSRLALIPIFHVKPAKSMPDLDNRILRYRHERSQINQGRTMRHLSRACLAGVVLGALFMLLA